MKKAIFIVEGETEERFVKSNYFKDWLELYCRIKLIKVIVCHGNGEMRSDKLQHKARIARKMNSPDFVIALADLDRDQVRRDQIKCITARKKYMENSEVNLIIIARNAIEAWFLADTEAMRSWRGKGYEKFRVEEPEIYSPPWDELIKLSKVTKRPLSSRSSKPDFADFFIKEHRFDLERAAEHKRCPSAKYCIDQLKKLGQEGV